MWQEWMPGQSLLMSLRYFWHFFLGSHMTDVEAQCNTDLQKEEDFT